MSKYLLLVYSIIFCFNIFSQGYQVNFQGQKQQGMASAGTALPQDASTIFFNPGALSFLKQNEINAAITPTFSSILFEEEGTNLNAVTNSPVGTPFSFYANFKKKEASKCGLCKINLDISHKEHIATETHKQNKDILNQVKALISTNKKDELIKNLKDLSKHF